MHLTILFYHTCYFICKCNEGYQIYTAVEYDFSDLMSLRVTVMFHFGSAKFTMNFTNKTSPYYLPPAVISRRPKAVVGRL